MLPLDRRQSLQRHLATEVYRYEPAAFAVDCIDWPEGWSLAPYQEETLNGIVEFGKVAERGPHGLGKTATAAIAVLWFAVTSDGWCDWKNPITASKWRHLDQYLWPEIHKWAARLRWERLARAPWRRGGELLETELNLQTGSAFAVASNEAANIEGAHAQRLFYIYDEAKTIPDEVWDASDGAFANAGPDTDNEAYALAFSTPGEPSGRFFLIHKKAAGLEHWHTRHVTVEEAIAAGRVSRAWVEEKARQWGRGNPVFQNRVEGNFAEQATDAVIPLSWVEQANERWETLMGRPEFAAEWIARGELPERIGEFTCAGVDVADEGEDDTVLAIRHGDVIVELRAFGWGDTMETAGRAAGVLRAHGGYVVVDSIGVGAGVKARLSELSFEEDSGLSGIEVFGFVASEGSDRTDLSGELEFANRRAEGWWGLREMLDPAFEPRLALPPDERLIGDLTTPKWRIASGGRIVIESKEQIRERIGRSTDYGDAVVMAMWEPPRKRKGGLLA